MVHTSVTVPLERIHASSTVCFAPCRVIARDGRTSHFFARGQQRQILFSGTCMTLNPVKRSLFRIEPTGIGLPTFLVCAFCESIFVFHTLGLFGFYCI